MNATTAIEEVRARIQELQADFWTSAEVYRALNEAQRRFSAQEKWSWLYTRGTDTLTAGDETLPLPAGVSAARVFNIQLALDGVTQPFIPQRVGPAEGLRLAATYFSAAATPMAYYLLSEEVADSNELQSLANSGSTASTFTITFDGQTTAAISRGASAAAIQQALVALSNVGAADVSCYGGPLGTDTVYIQFRGALGGTDVPAITLGGLSTANLTVATPNPGGGNSGEYTTTVQFVPALTRDADVSYVYIRDPRVLSTGTDVLDVPEEYAMGVVAYATGLLWLKELQDSRKADEQFALYASIVQDALRESRKLNQDSGFAWGRNQPEFGFVSEDDYTYRHFTGPLGP